MRVCVHVEDGPVRGTRIFMRVKPQFVESAFVVSSCTYNATAATSAVLRDDNWSLVYTASDSERQAESATTCTGSSSVVDDGGQSVLVGWH